MYRVVIVDDEEPVLDSFSFILEKESENFCLCGKARSGTEAINVVSDTRPDLVFMDIQMPGIDGLEAVTQIRQRMPEVVFILATAYERFDIAQKAIPLGVFSYLVKPISRKAFVNELHRVKLHLDHTRQRTSLELQNIGFMQKTKEEIKNKLLAGLAWGNPTSEDWDLFSRLFALKTEHGMIRLVGICDDVPEDAKEAIFSKLREKVQYKFNSFHCSLAGRLLLFFPDDQNLDTLDPWLDEMAAGYAPIAIAVGRGRTCHYSQLATSVAEAYLPFVDTAATSNRYAREKEEMQSICASLLRADFGRGLELLEDFSIRVFRIDPFEVAKAKMVSLFTLLWAELDGQMLSAAGIDLNPPEAITRIGSVEEWRTWLSDTLRLLQSVTVKPDDRNLPPHLSKALALIHKNYNKPIQLTSVADECQISANYLCRLFSEHLGTSFVEYLTQHRIEQAIGLLRDKRLSIKETSGLVGFQDPNYFSRIFRRYVGLSPSDLVNRRIHNDR